jgi:nucleoside-diphosphate-sugar epimerase
VAAVTPDRAGHVEQFATNVAIATTVARHVERHGAGRLVFVSSDAVYGDRDEVSESSPIELQNAYAVAKFASERILACVAAARAIRCSSSGDDGLRPKATRTVNMAEPVRKDDRARAIRHLFGEGEEQRDHVCIDDLVRCSQPLSPVSRPAW